MTVYLSAPDGVLARVGEHLGYSDYLEITQERIDEFARATGDFQWIHVDRERALAGPYKAPIAHGFLILSIGTALTPVFKVEGMKMGVNYGLNKVRFPSPVVVGSRLRVGITLLQAEMVKPNVLQIVFESRYECEGASKPACVAEHVAQYFL
jgi:acyl dehydratase